MLTSHFRPWGQIDWILSKLIPKKWSVLGALGTESRSLAVTNWFGQHAHLHESTVLLDIEDPPSRFTGLARQLRRTRMGELIQTGLSDVSVVPTDLFALDEEIVASVDNFLST